MRYVSIDIETTGLDPRWHSIIEFAAVLEDTEYAAPFSELPIFHALLVPHTSTNWELQAMQMHAKSGLIDGLADPSGTPEEIKIITPDTSGLIDYFGNWLRENKIQKTFTVAGKNFSGFDLQFLLKENLRWGSLFHHRVLDPGSMFVEPGDTTVPNLSTCRDRAGIDNTVTHTAVDDAFSVIECIRAALKEKKNNG